jgi:hypothetical protein
MIVDDLNVPGFAVAPHKTDPPLIVNANAALTLAVAVQSLQTIAGRHTQIVELLRRVTAGRLDATTIEPPDCPIYAIDAELGRDGQTSLQTLEPAP